MSCTFVAALRFALLRPLLIGLAGLTLAAPLHAEDLTAPTPDELRMTADPAAPGAPAVFLYREETVDDPLHYHSLYVRIKVLTEKGKSWGDVEIPYEGRAYSVTDISGRTIHPDGTIIPMTARPLQKMLMRAGEQQVKETVFSLPAVEPGSILEYRYILRYQDSIVSSPRWLIQQPIYLHKAHYRFVPLDLSGNRYVTVGHGDVAGGLVWSGSLPKGAAVKTTPEPGGVEAYLLDVSEVPALPEERDMPPIESISYRLLFYYASARTSDEYWKREGKFWSRDVDRFATPSPAMHAAVASLTAPADTPELKLHKLYSAVMELENTSFTREHSQEENKAEGLKVKTADDIWAQKRGDSTELTRLFLALARAAGFKAYDMIVVNRDRDILVPGYMEWHQLDDEIAIVQLDGADHYFDPGERYAEFGKLHWKHTWASGLRQVDSGGAAIAQSGGISYKDSQIGRNAEIQLDGHGAVTGTVRVLMSGPPALYWRQQALRVDNEDLHKEYDRAIREEFPVSVEVKLDHFINLTDPDHLLMAVLKVEGSLGTSTGHRVILPASFYASNATRLFPGETRQTAVDLHYPLFRSDTLKLTLPANLKVESLPKDGNLGIPKEAVYTTHYTQTGDIFTFQRTFVLGECLFLPAEYGTLRDFYQKMGAKDEEQAVFTLAPAQSGGVE